jgi:hypothetical protein
MGVLKWLWLVIVAVVVSGVNYIATLVVEASIMLVVRVPIRMILMSDARSYLR